MLMVIAQIHCDQATIPICESLKEDIEASYKTTEIPSHIRLEMWIRYEELNCSDFEKSISYQRRRHR